MSTGIRYTEIDQGDSETVTVYHRQVSAEKPRRVLKGSSRGRAYTIEERWKGKGGDVRREGMCTAARHTRGGNADKLYTLIDLFPGR